jgi:DNA-binding MarR family transcriptional regulator
MNDLSVGPLKPDIEAVVRETTELRAVENARSILDLHGRISRRLGEGMFDNPGLLMLLRLFIARVEQRTLQVKALALYSGVPASTAQRWIDRLQIQGLLTKRTNERDHRSSLVTITNDAFDAIKRLLTATDFSK